MDTNACMGAMAWLALLMQIGLIVLFVLIFLVVLTGCSMLLVSMWREIWRQLTGTGHE